MIDRAAWLDQHMARLRQLEADVRALRQAAAAAPDVEGDARDREIDELETRVRILSDQVAELRTGTGEVWKLLHDSFHERVEQLSAAVASVLDGMDA